MLWCHACCALLCIDCVHSCQIPKRKIAVRFSGGKCLVISGTSDCALYFCYHVCAEILTEAVKEMVLWYFIFGLFYFCSLDSQEF